MKIKLEPWAYMPERAHTTDAGADLRVPYNTTIMPKSSVVIDTGVHIELPPNTMGVLKSKSGLNVKHDITTVDGVIDVGYTGSIAVKLFNHSDKPYELKAGDKITHICRNILRPQRGQYSHRCRYRNNDSVQSLIYAGG